VKCHSLSESNGSHPEWRGQARYDPLKNPEAVVLASAILSRRPCTTEGVARILPFYLDRREQELKRRERRAQRKRKSKTTLPLSWKISGWVEGTVQETHGERNVGLGRDQLRKSGHRGHSAEADRSLPELSRCSRTQKLGPARMPGNRCE